jgi:methionyl-tRNA formyltransferase
MKLILMGTPDFVVPIFDAIAARHEIAAVFTRAPKPAGRKRIMTKTPVHIWAESRGIPVFTNINEFTIHNSQFTIDYIVVAAYGVILKQNVLDFAPCVNIHPSLLPKYRGPTPVETAILNGETESGVCLMQMTAGVDAGDILMREKFPIGINDYAADVYRRVSEIAPKMVLEYLDAPEKYPPRPQVGEPTFTRKFTRDDRYITYDAEPPIKFHNIVRAIGGWSIIDGVEVKITRTEMKDDGARIADVQPAGGRPMKWRDFLNGRKNAEI